MQKITTTKPLKTNTMKTLLELQLLIIEWAKDKNIHLLECAPKQRLKLIEECGELASSILKSKINEQKDAIGDIMVVLIILAEQENSYLNPIESIEQANDTKPTYFKEIPIWSFLSLICGNNKSDENTMYLQCICLQLDLDLEECTNLAWNEIKDRKGKTVNGTFIKN
jgi:NTP pyrophosphatase (non-canonical NTP hydrolase)